MLFVKNVTSLIEKATKLCDKAIAQATTQTQKAEEKLLQAQRDKAQAEKEIRKASRMKAFLEDFEKEVEADVE
tara:strand:- start:66 stop:284 length:219 start_codon:yes stop_codon:yes gene_type:complete